MPRPSDKAGNALVEVAIPDRTPPPRSASTWPPPATPSSAIRSTWPEAGTAPEAGLPGDPGYRLHAHRLVLAHPVTGDRLALECVRPLRG